MFKGYFGSVKMLFFVQFLVLIFLNIGNEYFGLVKKVFFHLKLPVEIKYIYQGGKKSSNSGL